MMDVAAVAKFTLTLTLHDDRCQSDQEEKKKEEVWTRYLVLQKRNIPVDKKRLMYSTCTSLNKPIALAV